MDTYGVEMMEGIRRDAVVVADSCNTGNEFDGRIAIRISAIFVIGLGSLFGALFPVFANRYPQLNVPNWILFLVKYFGSGVIIATSFIHLLAPANEALTNPCLTGIIAEYPWAEGIALMAVFSLFFVELLASSFATFSVSGHEAHDGHEHGKSSGHVHNHKIGRPQHEHHNRLEISRTNMIGQDHLSHMHEHTDIEADAANTAAFTGHGTVPGAIETRPSSSSGGRSNSIASEDSPHVKRQTEMERENYTQQMTSIFILEFGIIFHSIFIGLTLAVAGAEFQTLYIVLAFHQTFEGLGLGTRLAVIPFPKSKRWTPYVMAVVFGFSTPIAIAIGLGIRNSYPPEGRTTLVVNGVFDSLSAGILLYSGLVELMAHEFLYSETLRKGPRKVMFMAFLCMVLGAALMALLGKWA